jgi:hypothetical protein
VLWLNSEADIKRHSASSVTSPPPTRGSNLQFELPTPRDNAANAAGAQSNTHIAFLENQRAPNRGKALRIPGPREFEQGIIRR